MSLSLVTAFLEALSAGDRAAALALVSDDVIHDPASGPRIIGRDSLAIGLARRASHFHERISDIAVMTGGMRAAAEFTLKGEYSVSEAGLPKAEGQRYSVQAGAFFEIEDGRITRFSLAVNLAELARQIAAG